MCTKIIITLLLAFCCFRFAGAQELSTIGENKPFDIHGSIGGGTTFYTSNEPFDSRDPFTWNLHGGLTPSFYGFAIPLSFSVTQFSNSYSTPFSQFGLSPTYKWATLHLGYRSISFSPFVYDGQSFLGAGIELTPKNFYIAAFYGRLNKAISEDTTVDRHFEPQYARRGYGLKVGVRKEKREIYLHYFHARDDTSSIKRYDSTSTLLPEENNVVGSSWRFLFFDKLSFSGDIAASLWNRDRSYAALDSIGEKKIPGAAHLIAAPITYSSVFSWSGQAQLGINLNHMNAMLGYRRVEPDFKSLGIPYMLNDMETFNGNVGANLLKGRLSLNAGYSTQHNNLRNMLSSQLNSSTGNFSANALISDHFNLNANLATAKVFQKDGLEKLTDSTRMNQFMTSLTVNPSLHFLSEQIQHTIGGSFSFTDLNDKNPMTKTYANGQNFNTSLNYSMYFTQKYFGVNVGIQQSKYNQVQSSFQSLGINLGANTQLLKSRALSLQGNVGYFSNKDSDSPTGNNITFSLNSSIRVGQHHSFSLYTSYILTPPVNLNPLNEINKVPYAVNSKILSGGFNYSYNF